MEGSAVAELRLQLLRGMPVSMMMLARRSLDVISLTFIGQHLHEAPPMAAAALAISTTSVFALSVFVGLSSATVTLTSQARGAGDTTQAAYWLHRGMLIHAMFALPITAVLLQLEQLLLFMGQEPDLARSAGEYCYRLLPGMWAWAFSWVLTPWMQSHGVVMPALIVALVVLGLHIGLLFLFFLSWDLGLYGAAYASSCSQMTNLLLLILIVGCFFRSFPLRCLSRASFARWRDHLRLSLPGVLMLGEWWAAEVGILLTGLLPDPATNLAAMSVYQSVNAMAFMLPIGASIAGATRVGAALGAGDATSARLSAKVCVGLCIAYGCVASLVILTFRTQVGAAFTTSEAVLDELSGHLLPFLVVYVVADAGQVGFSGILQGCGRQRTAGPVVLLSYYLVGLPIGSLLAFYGGLGAQGIVTGSLCGKVVHCLAYGGLVLRTDWDEQCKDAAERVAKEERKSSSSPRQLTAMGDASTTHTRDTGGRVDGLKACVDPSGADMETSVRAATGAMHLAPQPRRYASFSDEL